MLHISVIIINLNNKTGLRNSIQSYLNQNSSSSELIVIDGLSDDGSVEVINIYKTQINKLIIEVDNGIFDAMNKGVDLAEGRYIYFLNSGEVFYSNDVLCQVSHLSKLIHSNVLYFNVEFLVNGKRSVLKNNLTNWFVHQGAFVKTTLMKQYKFDIRYKVFGDLDLWTRLKRDKLFELSYLNMTVTIMDLDGIGSNPSIPLVKIRDKLYFAFKNRIYLKSFISILNILFAFLITRLFGKNRMYSFFNNVRLKVNL